MLDAVSSDLGEATRNFGSKSPDFVFTSPDFGQTSPDLVFTTPAMCAARLIYIAGERFSTFTACRASVLDDSGKIVHSPLYHRPADVHKGMSTRCQAVLGAGRHFGIHRAN